MESPGTYVDDRVSSGPFSLVPVFFRTALPRSGGSSLDKCKIPLYDAVGEIVNKRAITEYQGAGA